MLGFLNAATLRNATLDAIAILLPVECAGCGLPDRALCLDCREMLTVKGHRFKLPDGTIVVSALRYEAVVRSAILAFKEGGRTDIAGALALPLLAVIEGVASDIARGKPPQRSDDAFTVAGIDAGLKNSDGDRPLELVTIPSTRRAWHQRGYRPVPLLISHAGLRQVNILRHTRARQGSQPHRQKLLGQEARASNIRGRLQARCPLGGRRFLLIDDVLTTGATLQEAVRAIREAGGVVVVAVTLAFTPRHFPEKRGAHDWERDIHSFDGYGS